MRKALPLLVSLLVLVVLVQVFRTDVAFLTRIRNAVFDTYQQIDPREPLEGSPVLILDIDEESLKRVGQWPWPRDLLAAITRRVQDMGSAVIAYDIFFAEPDRTSPERIVDRLPRDLQLRLEGATLPDYDEIFAEVIGRGRVVLGQNLSHGDPDTAPPPPPKKFGYNMSGPDPIPYLRPYDGITRTIPVLEEAAAGLGSITFAPDKDGVVRLVPLFSNYKGTPQAALAMEALRVAQGARSYSFKSIGGSGEEGFGALTGVVAVKNGTFVIPTDKRAGLRIHYAHKQTQDVVPIWKVIEGEVDPQQFAGRIVFVGASASGLKDLRFNTLGEEVPGVFMHGQIIDQIISKSFLVRPDWAFGAELIGMVVISILLVGVVYRFGALVSAFLGGMLMLSGIGASGYAFLEMRLLFDPLLPSAGALVVFMICSGARYWQVEGEQRFVRNAFKSYVSPNLVEVLVKNPEKLKLGGERRACTFIFTDLAGFTSFVEKADPEIAVPILNEYVDEMTQIGFKHGGTLDKIVGDATVFYFNAPVDQQDHAIRAYNCAVEMHEWASAYSKRKTEEGIPVGATRVGVNSGEVTIGNFGGKVFDYTAHGDAINTAARLESVNKQLGTEICVSSNTANQVPDFIGRPIGTLVLKGKTEGLRCYEPMNQERYDGAVIQAYMTAFEKMCAEAPDTEAAFEHVLELSPEDGPSKLHLRRLREGQTGERIVLSEK